MAEPAPAPQQATPGIAGAEIGGGAEGKAVSVAEVQTMIDKLYGDRHAKHLGDGLVKGAVSVGKGIFAGVGGLIAAPLAGAAKGGFGGFLTGTAVGVAGVVMLPTIGVVHGVRQVGSGIKHTPDAVKVKMMKSDKNEEAAEKAEVIDDPEVEQVNEKTYSKSRDAVEGFAFTGNPAVAPPPEAPASTDASADGSTGPAPGSGLSSAASSEPGSGAYEGTPTPKETFYYEVLHVSSTAKGTEIKKAYYKLAVKLHPDKNPGDETANDKFAELGEAYQILMDPEKRELYDKYGKDGLQESATMDPRSFFTMVFGAEAFKPLVGELTLAYTAGQNVTQEQFRAWQNEREQELAKTLLDRLHPWLQGQEEEFVSKAVALVEELKNEAFAPPMLECIGYTYYHKAEVCLGLQSLLGLPGYINALRLHGHNFKAQYRAVDAAVRLQEMNAKAQAGEAGKASLPEFLNAIWMISALDIESTLRHVVELVIMDKSISKEERKNRARGIMRLGKIFLEACKQ